MSGFVVTWKLAWWFDLYVGGLAVFCFLFRTVPDTDQVERVVCRALRGEVRKKGGG